jgi:hypothetical protein
LADVLAACIWRFAELTAYVADSDETDEQAAEELHGWISDIASAVMHEVHTIRETARDAARDDDDDDDDDDTAPCSICGRKPAKPERWSPIYEHLLVALQRGAGRTLLQANAIIYGLMVSGAGPAVLRPMSERVTHTLDDGREIKMPCSCDYDRYSTETDRYMSISPTARKAAWKELGRKRM